MSYPNPYATGAGSVPGYSSQQPASSSTSSNTQSSQQQPPQQQQAPQQQQQQQQQQPGMPLQQQQYQSYNPQYQSSYGVYSSLPSNQTARPVDYAYQMRYQQQQQQPQYSNQQYNSSQAIAGTSQPYSNPPLGSYSYTSSHPVDSSSPNDYQQSSTQHYANTYTGYYNPQLQSPQMASQQQVQQSSYSQPAYQAQQYKPYQSAGTGSYTLNTSQGLPPTPKQQTSVTSPKKSPSSSHHQRSASSSNSQQQRKPSTSAADYVPISPTVGQIHPPGLRPKITTTMWEDEKTLCYQVEANGVAVVRRADNDMINGTKLLNVAKMTRGRRDGILKSEKTRQVVKIGSMHLKGVWIPFERALAMAQRENIVDMLYPLFVKDIKKVIQQGTPTNQVGQISLTRPEDNASTASAAPTNASPNIDKPVPTSTADTVSSSAGSSISHSIPSIPSNSGTASTTNTTSNSLSSVPETVKADYSNYSSSSSTAQQSQGSHPSYPYYQSQVAVGTSSTLPQPQPQSGSYYYNSYYQGGGQPQQQRQQQPATGQTYQSTANSVNQNTSNSSSGYNQYPYNNTNTDNEQHK